MNRELPPAPIFNPDGSLNEGNLNQQYGLGIDEAMQEVTFGRYRGTVAEMLADVRCPVGGMIRTAYQCQGIDGVVEQFGALSQMDRNFKVEIKKETRMKNQEKKIRPAEESR